MIQTAHARAVMSALRDAGVDRVVVSPGSRSTPLVAAALARGLDCRVVIDERSAAHVALGIIRVSNRPVAVLCTSGSAAACYLPAVVEAHHARLPLVVITADRPPELRDCEAPQTIDQQQLYGSRVRAFVDLGVPEGSRRQLLANRRRVAQAIYASVDPEPGPVHLNVPLRKPLEPTEPIGELARALAEAEASPLSRSPAPARTVADSTLDAIASACRSATRGVITAGPAPLASAAMREPIAELCRQTGMPLMCEAPSQLRLTEVGGDRIGSFDLLYARPGLVEEPDFVLQLGSPPVSSTWGALLERVRPPRMIITEHGWPDPAGGAELIAGGDLANAVARLATRLEPGDRRYRDRLAAADERAWQLLERELGDAGDPMSELAAVRAAVAALPAGALLAVGNSLPVRSVDLVVPPGSVDTGALHQRGASGIDGVLSAAIGSATATDRPILLLIGDVSFAHDIGALAAARQLAAPLCAVVIDNRGGRIFERLPVATSDGLADRFEPMWLTPPEVDIAMVAAGFGLPALSATQPASLAEQVSRALRSPGLTVVRAVVEPGSAERGRQRLLDRLHGGDR